MTLATAPSSGGSAPGIGHAPAGSLTLTIDRWIYVFMAAWFIAITLTGFIPDSLYKIALVEAGQRPPFPVILHIHAVLMGAFLLLLLAQATLMATGRRGLHQQLGVAGFILAPAIVIAGIILVPAMYQMIWTGMQAAPPEARRGLEEALRGFDNIMLMQIRAGAVFTALIAIALLVRRRNSGLHKRLMFLSITPALPAAFDRITWIPHTLPASPLSPDLYILLAIAPMLIWDVARTRTIHRAYIIWAGVSIPFSLATHLLWDSDWWHTIAPRIGGV